MTSRHTRSARDFGYGSSRALVLALLATLGTALVGAGSAACNKKEGSATPAASSAPAAARSATPADAIPALENTKAPEPPAQIPAPPDVAAPPADAQKTASGLTSKVLQKGTGTVRPTPSDKVKVNYTGWTTDGKMFDSTSSHGGEPATFGVGQVIPGWTEGLQLMVAGEKRRFWIPGKLAYGDTPRMQGAPAGNLTFDVELLDIVKPPPVPADVKAPPASATKTASGLAYRILEPSKDASAQKPGPASVVTVSYSGWQTDGKMFDSSAGDPVSFPLNRVIKGWTEGLQLMKVGDKARFWIPGPMAYDDPARPARPGVPHGMLVFDVELLGIKQP
jgi:FKBP-type peptidyl-prolyl cis-trans isomerase